MTLLFGIVMVLLGWAVALALVAVLQRALGRRRQRRRRRLEAEWRVRVDGLVLDATPLPRAPRRERSVVLDLLLRYQAILRGPEAVRITEYLEEQGYVRQAVDGLHSRSRWRRATSADLLGRMKSDAAVAALVELMDDGSEDVRVVAARSLAAIGDPRAVEALTAALSDSSRWTATTVATNLIEMGPAAVPTLIDIASAADSGGRGQYDAAVTAIRVLGEIRDPRAETVLIRLLSEGAELNARARAAAALGAVGGPLAPPALRAALLDGSWQVRAQAASSLGALGDRDSVQALMLAIEDDSWWVRRNCAEALGALGQPGREALRTLTGSSDRYVRDCSRGVLQQLQLEGDDGDVSPALPGADA